VLVPGDHMLKMASLYYPQYDPLWEACAELELPVHKHAAAPTESFYEGGKASQLVHFAEIQFYTARAIGHLIFAGVFERYPKLKFVTTEIASAAGIAQNLATITMMAKLGDMGSGTPFYEHVKDALADLHRSPAEYFATNCYVGGPHDLRQAFDAGIPNLMWGADIPHAEGTAPFTVEALRATLWDLPEDDIATLLATRAAEVYKFDLARLQPVADRIGPTIAQLKTPLSAAERPKYPEETCCSVFREAAA
jgi:predicted TIM-barrel fold metal-dependent hydrolase